MAIRGYITLRTSQPGTQRIDKCPSVINKKAPFVEGAFSFVVIAKFFHLLLQEAGFEDDAAAVDFAVYLLVVVGKTNALHLGATLDDH